MIIKNIRSSLRKLRVEFENGVVFFIGTEGNNCVVESFVGELDEIEGLKAINTRMVYTPPLVLNSGVHHRWTYFLIETEIHEVIARLHSWGEGSTVKTFMVCESGKINIQFEGEIYRCELCELK